MSDYTTLRTSILNMHNANDRVMLDGNSSQKEVKFKTSSEHKHSFTLFSSSKKATNARISEENAQAADKLKNIIAKRFGNLGKQMFEKTFKSGKELTVGKLKALFTSFDKTEKTHCNNVIKMQISGQKYKDQELNIFNKMNSDIKDMGLTPTVYNDTMAKASVLLTDQQTDIEGIRQQNEDLQQSLNKLQGYEQKIHTAANKPGKALTFANTKAQMQRDISDMKAKIEAKIAQNNAEIANDPRAVQNLKDGFDNVYTSALLTLQFIKQEYQHKHIPVPQQINDMEQRLTNEMQTRFAGKNATDIVSKDEIKSVKTLKENLDNELKGLAKLSSPKVVSSKAISKTFKQCGLDVLNKNANSWKPISKQLLVTGFGKSSSVTSNIVPAHNLQGFDKLYEEGIRGISSNDRGNKHASNLCLTNVQDSNGKVIFQGIRHGVNCAFGIDDKAERTRANIQRTKEVLTAALMSKPELLRQALSGQKVSLPIVSTSLLTPSKLFGRKERTYLEQQNQAWDLACTNGECKLQVPDANGNLKTVTIKPDVVKFNFGVNAYSHNVVGYIGSLGGGWDLSDSMLQQGLSKLIGLNSAGFNADSNSMVGKFLKANPNLPQAEKAKINKMVAQIREMYADKSYKKNTVDPYALPARIAVLANLIGAVPTYNCKSGKDRTSLIDAEAKSIALQLNAGQTPNIDQTQDKNQHGLTMNMIRNSGNLELQKYNTGFEGYKINYGKGANVFLEIPGFSKLFENSDAHKYFKGASAATKS